MYTHTHTHSYSFFFFFNKLYVPKLGSGKSVYICCSIVFCCLTFFHFSSQWCWEWFFFLLLLRLLLLAAATVLLIIVKAVWKICWKLFSEANEEQFLIREMVVSFYPNDTQSRYIHISRRYMENIHYNVTFTNGFFSCSSFSHSFSPLFMPFCYIDCLNWLLCVLKR